MKIFLQQYGIHLIMSLVSFMIMMTLLPIFMKDNFNTNEQITLSQQQTKNTQSKNIDLSNFDTANVNNMDLMFKHQIKLENFNSQNVNKSKNLNIIKNIGITIFLLIINLFIIIKDICQYSQLLKNKKQYHFKKNTIKVNPIDINYINNCSLVFY